MNTNAPHRLGRYQLLERIAVGGMAEVYKAVAQGLSGFEKIVVVKRLLPQHQRDQELLTMFVDEARLLGRMHHQNIAEVYDIDHDGNEYFFALEFVDGVDVRALLDACAGQPLPLDEALWITIELARALTYAHTLASDEGRPLHIVHRDVSPSNVIVDREAAVKLVDFGVAKWASQRSETRHGVLKGKVNYMSPEQCRGELLDQRSDIFSLGVLLYEMTVGEKPFAAASDFETLKAIAEGHYVLPSLRRPDYPRTLEQIVEKALELRPEDRFINTSELVDQLDSFARTAGMIGPPRALALRVQDLCAARPHVHAPTAALADTVVKAPIERTATTAALSGVPPSVALPARVRQQSLWPLVFVSVLILTGGWWLWTAGESHTSRREPQSQTTSAVAGQEQVLPAVVAKPQADPKVAPVPPPLSASDARPARPKSTAAKSVAAKPAHSHTSAAVSQPAVASPSPASVWDPDSPVPP